MLKTAAAQIASVIRSRRGHRNLRVLAIFFLVLAWLASQIAALQSARAEDEAFKKRMRERFVRSGKDAWANKMELENKLGYSRETSRPSKPDADPDKIAAA